MSWVDVQDATRQNGEMIREVTSTGQRNKLGEFFHGHYLVEGLAGSSVKAALNSREVLG